MKVPKEEKQIITVKEARKLLGIDAKHLDDETIEAIVDSLTQLAHIQVNIRQEGQ
ncbi:MAG: hypothetical protein TR69_WS6001000895 [candidate division WS6 bacterium OLB20]|uniref:Uncharacterized protein n=1 Tax=candidate division WS6 bacterium OLB20 TaxID=1617426 RepID=A0A136LYX7_9BACT|nr:MAG: hypothetical protein TR69_WS6001000895 [candidate division WS6 bacterium OLB20]